MWRRRGKRRRRKRRGEIYRSEILSLSSPVHGKHYRTDRLWKDVFD
jgi:ribosomal protein S6E (S10)